MIRAAVLLLALGAGPATAADCAPDRLDLRGAWGSARFSVELADSERERARGLMHRDSLAASQGMLFVYDTPGKPAFWMKNTLIPLDMLFVTPEGEVAHVHENAIPGDLTPIDGGDGILAVLEIKGGLAAAMRISVGSELRHPAFDQSLALWACDTTD
ncbi:DUF192 domain-containing protein [Aliiroseovarius subalbicans]|uniref:DUF192 domain-containing protein n=1 Tax=Aliiroseovarius subalbicans TaxID=2925840 RepID=UPI001F570A76|nr:DUF192 domain-containing protein [Aliiroseovarius subalbicans]MCI2398470.1 DUF192 domain-containing protein [Aliiroseovarius subalbicans]